MRNAAWIGVGVMALAAVLTGQSATPSDRVMQELLTEVKALRSEVNRAAGSSIRAQLLATRLQLQEQRILTVSRQIDEVQKELAGVAQARAAINMVVKQGSGDDPRDKERMLDMFKSQLDEYGSREQQLRQHESSLMAMLAEEQARWTDFSSRLDELERALPAARPR
jgi:phage-related minor tail protein